MCRLARRYLRFNALGLFKITLYGQQHAHGIVVRSTQHKWRAAFSQRNQQVVGVAHPVGIRNDGGDVVERDLAQLLALPLGVLHDHESTVDTQVSVVIGHFDNAANHDG
jgi:hypothetical protein